MQGRFSKQVLLNKPGSTIPLSDDKFKSRRMQDKAQRKERIMQINREKSVSLSIFFKSGK